MQEKSILSFDYRKLEEGRKIWLEKRKYRSNIYNSIGKYIEYLEYLAKEEKYNLCVQEYEKVRTKLNKEPSVEELWKGLFIKYSSAREIYNTVNFIYEDVNEDIYEEKYEEINDRVDSGLFKKNIIDKKLDGNQKDALLLKYGFVNGKMYSLRQIAKKIGYSHQGVDHLINYGEKKLKKVIKEEY